jgi:hypothetical protein
MSTTRKLFHLFAVLPLLTSCVNYTVLNYTQTNVCDNQKYISTESHTYGGVRARLEDEERKGGDYIPTISAKEIKMSFTVSRLLSYARKKYNDSTLNITNIRYDMRNLNVFTFNFRRPDAVTYDVFKCE